jgi:cytochrome c biogenesis protein CcmG/thiol:disulfide interchange protein DsbE
MPRRYKPIIWAFVAVILFASTLFYLWSQYSDFLSQGQRPPEQAVKLNEIEAKGVPVQNYKTIDGRDITLEEFRGKIVILNFWASWCDPCVAEFPSLMALLKKFENQVELIAVSGDYEEADIHTFLKSFAVKSNQVHVVWDKELDISKKFGTFRLPESYIIGKRGELIRKVSGVDDWSSPEAFEYFGHLLAQEK